MIQIILNTSQNLTTFKDVFKFDFRQVPEMVDNTYLLNTHFIEDWDLLHTELAKGNLEVVGIWNQQGEFLTDENAELKDKDKTKLKEEKNKFKKVKYKSKLKQIVKYNEITDEVELVDAPEDMQVNTISGWNYRTVNIDEV